MKTFRKFIKETLDSYPTLGLPLRLAHRRFWRARQGYPDWPALLARDWGKWKEALAAAQGPRVLLATSVGAYLPGATIESALAAALTLRGARVEALLCDEALPACFDCHRRWFPNPEALLRSGPQGRLCGSCFPPAKRMYERLGIQVLGLSAWYRAEDRADLDQIRAGKSLKELAEFRENGMALGEHALAGTLRFFARATLEEEPLGQPVFARYFEAAFFSARAARRMLGEQKYERVVFNHGIYVPQGLLGEAARSLGIPVVNWNPAYRRRCFIFSHGDSYHRTLMSEPVTAWENLELSPEQDQALEDYILSRRHGTQDWIWFHENPRFGADDIRRAVGADPAKPWIGLLTNVLWDAQLHFSANAFPNLMDWLFRTIDYFEARPDLQLIVRVHPAEIRGTLPSRQRITDEIARRGKPLPKNVFVVGPEDPVSTYALMERCNAVLIYGTKTGVELASMGIPVVVAGEAWIRNKGLTRDAESSAHYFRLLDALPAAAPMSRDQVRRARLYAYHFFFRRMIPLACVEPCAGDPPFRPVAGLRLNDLADGADGGLDVVCRGILERTPFVYPAEDKRIVRRQAGKIRNMYSRGSDLTHARTD